MSEHIEVLAQGGRMRIRMNRPQRRTAITVAMYAALADAIESAGADDSIRLITIEGGGEDFTAGNDLADFLAEMPPPGATDSAAVSWANSRTERFTRRESPASRSRYSMMRSSGLKGASSSRPRERTAILTSSASETPRERFCFRR